MSGDYVVQTHNSGCALEEEHIRFVPMVSPSVASDDLDCWVTGDYNDIDDWGTGD